MERGTLLATIQQTLSELRRQLDLVDAAIRAVEKHEAAERAKSSRGRKFMGEAERLVVSRRMTEYWASRRKAPRAS